jgi:hypothetical protein
MRRVDVGVCGDEVRGDDGSKELGWVDWILFGEDVARLFLGVGGYDNGVVCCGVAVGEEC